MDVEWVDRSLEQRGRRRLGRLELHRSRPWGDVWRAPTDDGDVWLKVPAEATRFEVGLYEVLAREVPDVVLAPLAVDVERGWVLLPDAGPSLAAGEDSGVSVPELAGAMRRYAEAQLALAGCVEEMLALGVSDMRPAAMAERFEQALAAVRTRGVDPALLDEIGALGPRFAAGCAELAALPGAASLDHNDLHGLNILGRPGEPGSIRFYDWGDAVIAHPFACLLVPLGIASAHGPSAVDHVRDAYLEPFAQLGSPRELRETADLACWVAKVARALTWERALAAAGSDVDPDFAGAPLEHLAALRHESFVIEP